MKLTALLLAGFIFIAFSSAHSPKTVQVYLQIFYVTVIIFLYIIQSSAKSIIVDSIFIQIRTQGTEVSPWSTPDVTLTFPDNCPPTVTLCEWPKRNSLNHMITIESEAAIFVSSRSPGNKSNRKINYYCVCILASSSRESAMSSQIGTMWLSREYPGLKPCSPSHNHSLVSQTCLMYPAMTCSICFQTTKDMVTGL
jgi:hypothetical protein